MNQYRRGMEGLARGRIRREGDIVCWAFWRFEFRERARGGCWTFLLNERKRGKRKESR